MNQITKLKTHFGSVKEMLDFLNSHVGFEGIDRSTLSRWENKSDRALPPRALLAVKLIEARFAGAPRRLRIAEARTLQALPSTLAWLPMRNGTFIRLRDEYGINPEVQLFPTGGKALQLLVKGEVDVAIAADILIKNYKGPNCTQLCSVSRSPLLVVTEKWVPQHINSFEGKIIGYPEPSATPYILKDISRDSGVQFKKLVGLDSPEAARRALRNREVDAVVSWDWWIYEVIRGMRSSAMTIIPNMFGTMQLDLAVNLEVADPSAVRAYLKCISVIARNIKAFIPSYAPLEKHLNFKRREIESYLTQCKFLVGELNSETVLLLWEKEVLRASLN